MNKIFGIGLSRTGTTSCCELMKSLGFKSIHLPFSIEEIDEYTFSNDTSVSARFEELDLRYPNSKFIYTIRDPEQWATSCMKWVNLQSRNKFYTELPSDDVRQWISDGDLSLYNREYMALVDITKEEFLSAYQRHDRRVKEYFKDRADDLLIVDLTNEISQPFTKVVQFLERNNLLRIPNTNSSKHYSIKSERKISPQIHDDVSKSIAAQYKMARTWKQLGKPDQAEKSYRKIIKKTPESKEAYLLLSRLLIEKNEIDGAIEILRKGVEANPNEAELHKAFINAEDEAGKLESAFSYYELFYKGIEKIVIDSDDILCCVVVRNESLRLPYFLSYYRRKGITKFFIVDNNSTDDTVPYLLKQHDVYVWQSTLSFNKANFGSVWFELLLRKFGKGHWCLTLDADELLIYPDCEKKDIPQLCRELDQNNKQVFSAVLLDMYSDRPIKDTTYNPGQDFLEVCPYFDKKFYNTKNEKSGPYKNQAYYFGGVRQRVFGDTGAYLLSKIPLIKYNSNFILAGGQHWTNRPESEIADESGCLLHFKFFSSFIDYAKQEAERKEHYCNALQYQEYARGVADKTLSLYNKIHSIKFKDSNQLVDLGIMQIQSNRNEPSLKFISGKFPEIKQVSAGAARPFWSVMITVYNRTKYLEKALKSVLQQAPDIGEMQIEVIHDRVDEAMRNKIEKIVRTIGGKRVDFYAAEQQYGQPHIFNLCIKRANGQWIHILHDDDWIKPGFYSALQKGIEAEPFIGAAFCRHVHIKPSGSEHWVSRSERETPGIISNWLERIAVICRLQFSSIVVKREVYEKLGGFFHGANSAFDWDMWKRIAVHYPYWFEPEILACSYKDGQALTDNLLRSGQQVADTRKSIELSQSYLPGDVADQLTAKAKKHYANYALDIAKQFLASGDHEAVIANLQESLKCSQSNGVKQALVSLLLNSEDNPEMR